MVTTLRIPVWATGTSLLHVSSTWEIADGLDFTNILESVVDSVTFLNIYHSFLVIPVGVTYYARVKRKFDDNTTTTWLGPVPIKASNTIPTLDVQPPVLIEPPHVTVNMVELLDPLSLTFTITLSKMLSNGPALHTKTHWLLLSGSDVNLFKSLDDVTNLETLVVTKTDIGLDNLGKLKVNVSHVDSVGNESPFNEHVVNINPNSFDVDNDLTRVDYTVDLNATITLDPGIIVDITRIELISSSAVTVYDLNNLGTVTAFTIPVTYLLASNSYVLNIYFRDNIKPSVERLKSMTLTTVTDVNEFIIDPNFVYDHTYTNVNAVMPLGDYEVHSNENFNGEVILPKPNDVSMYRYKYDIVTNDLLLLDVIPGIILPTVVTPKMNILLSTNNILVLDTASDTNVPTFKIYRYNTELGSSVLLGSVTRADEVGSTVHGNSMVFTPDNKYLYYIPNDNTLGTALFRRLNLETFVIDELTPRTGAKTISTTLHYIGNNRYLSVGGNTDITPYVYRADLDTWSIVIPEIPIAFRDKVLCGIQIKDGSISFFNKSLGTRDILNYNPLLDAFTENANALAVDLPINNFIRLNSGDVAGLDTSTPSGVYLYS